MAVSPRPPRVPRPAVHALLHVLLIGAPLGSELLLLLSAELLRVEPRPAAPHAGVHGVAPLVHGVVAVRHVVGQHLCGHDTYGTLS